MTKTGSFLTGPTSDEVSNRSCHRSTIDTKDDLESYLFHFEQHATASGWRKDDWSLYLASLLTGKALSVYHSLSLEGAGSYDSLKTPLLRKVECTEEEFREKFRTVRPETGEPFLAFLSRARHFLDRWIDLSGIERNVDQLLDLFLREQILHSCARDL